MKEKEIWKDISGYEGYYQVSNLGRVKSLNRLTSHGHNRKGKLLSKIRHNDGYLHVDLCKNGSVNRISIHRLVAKAFIPNPDNLPEVNHIDEIKHHNMYLNLEWMTSRQNTNYSKNKKAKSKYPGISWYKRDNKWRAECQMNGIKYHLGYFDDELEAAKAYQDFCEKHNLK